MSNITTHYSRNKTFSFAVKAFGLFTAFTAVICVYSLSTQPKIADIVKASPDAQSMQLLVSGAETGDIGLPIARTISLRYLNTNAPVAADIAIVSSDLNQTLTHSTSKINLRQRASYSIELDIPAGAYAAMVSAPNIKTKVMPFIVEGSQEFIPVNLGSFEPADSIS